MAEIPDPKEARIVVVGAGHAGGTIVGLLRDLGHTGPLILIGEEAAAPYQRPPLSKDFLKGVANLESLLLRAEKYYHERHITLRLRARVEAIDPLAKQVRLEGGGIEAYDILILATGSQARRLAIPGADLKDLFELRNIPDAESIKAVLHPGHRLAIVGGGYVGLEVAASARALGAEAVVIERESRVLARVASEPLSRFFEKFHTDHGVTIITNAEVAAFEGGSNGFVNAIRLKDGRRIECDAAVIGVGAVASDQLARTAGLACENGVVVDETARTSDPFIYAIGDMTWRPLPLYDGRMFRLESVPNALEQAKQAACAILGKPAPEPAVPWFWSDQYDLKLQIAGVPFDAEDLLIRGSMDTAKFAIFHMKGDRILAVEAVNAPAEFMGGKQLIGTGKNVSRERLADPSVRIKEVAA